MSSVNLSTDIDRPRGLKNKDGKGMNKIVGRKAGGMDRQATSVG